MSDQAPAETLTECEAGDELQLTLDSGDTYRVYIVDSVDHAEADGYTKGSVSTSVELDTDEHEVPTEEHPTESGDLHARTTSRHKHRAEWGDLSLGLWDPIVSDDDPTHAVEDRWRTLGTVTDIDVVE